MASSIQQASDGGYIVAGTTRSWRSYGYDDFWVLKLDGNGKMDPSCDFISDTSVSPIVSISAVGCITSATNLSTSATIHSTGVTGVVSPGTDTLLCPSRPPEDCTNGVDDDGDGLVDCDDPECASDPCMHNHFMPVSC